jgi:hypothetical protein
MNDSCYTVRDVHEGELRILRRMTHLLVNVQLSEDLSGVKQVCVINDPSLQLVRENSACGNNAEEGSSLLDIVGKER